LKEVEDVFKMLKAIGGKARVDRSTVEEAAKMIRDGRPHADRSITPSLPASRDTGGLRDGDTG